MIDKCLIIAIKFVRKINEDDIFSLSAQFSYYIILGVFPFIFLMVSIFGHYSSFFYDTLKTMETLIPVDVYNIIFKIADDSVGFFDNSSYISVSILALIWSSSSGSVGIIKGINKAYNCPRRKNYIFMRLKGIFFTFALIFSLQVAFLFIVLGQNILFFLQSISVIPDVIYFVFNILRYIFPIFLLILIFSFTYKFLPYEKVHFVSVFPGAIFSTLGWFVGTFFFSIYIQVKNVFYTNIYGSMSGVFIFIIWVYLSSFIFLLGAELNAFISVEKSKW